MKKFLKGFFKTILAMTLVFCLFLVGVVAFVAESAEEFFAFRKDNVIEYFLNREDGISHFEMVKCVYTAYVTTIEAANKYPDNPMLEDAYKHYTWNYESTRLIGAEKTKLITDNHEIALSIRGRVDETFDSFLNEFEKEGGFLKLVAMPKAMIATINILPSIRSGVVADSRNADPSSVRDYYSSATIMDFYNNEVGRGDSLAYPDVSRSDAFKMRSSSNTIVLTYENLNDMYNDYTLDYVRNKICYWVSWLIRGRYASPLKCKIGKREVLILIIFER